MPERSCAEMSQCIRLFLLSFCIEASQRFDGLSFIAELTGNGFSSLLNKTMQAGPICEHGNADVNRLLFRFDDGPHERNSPVTVLQRSYRFTSENPARFRQNHLSCLPIKHPGSELCFDCFDLLG